jgi:hypothetical protein
VGGPLIGKPFDGSSNRPGFLKENPRDEALPDQFLHGQQDVGSESNETPMHELVVGLKATVKTDSEKPHKQLKQKHAALGF